MAFLKMNRVLKIFLAMFISVVIQSGYSFSEDSKSGKYITNPEIPSVSDIEVATDGNKFEYKHTLTRKAKKKSFKMRVAISTFENNLEIENSFFNIKDDKDEYDELPLKIEDSDVTVELERKEKKRKKLTKRDMLTGLLADALNNTGMFEVIERVEVNQLIREINFQKSNWAQDDGINKIGNIFGAQYILTADMLSNKDGERFGKGTYTLALRMYNVNTGKIVATSVSNFSYLKDAVMEGAENLVNSINAEPWTCRIVKIDGGIYINAGFADKLEKRDVFNVIKMEEKIVDPQTKEVLGYKRSKIGMIEVEEVLEKYLSLVKAVGTTGNLKVGDIIAADRVSEDNESERELYYEIFGKKRFSSTNSLVKLEKRKLKKTSGYGSSAEDIVSSYGKSIVLVTTGNSFGSGFVVSSDGYMLTNSHVVQGQKKVTVKFIEENKVYSNVEVVKDNPIRDLALLKINSPDTFSPVILGDSDNIEVGERVIVLGNPQGLENTVSDGLISSVRNYNGTTLLQISVPISPGSSGGALFNLQGEVIGVPTATLEEGQNLNFAVAINHAKEELLN